MKSRCLDFLVKATQEVKKRVPENVVVFQAVLTFSPSQILSATDVTMPAVRVKNICKDVEATNVEMKLLCKVPMYESVKKDSFQFWNIIRDFTDAGGAKRFGHISFALSLYSLPYSNAEVERIFSKLNYCKSNLRNKMKSGTVAAIIHVDCGLRLRQEKCFNFTITDLMKQKFVASVVL